MDTSHSTLLLNRAKGDKLSWRPLGSDGLHLGHINPICPAAERSPEPGSPQGPTPWRALGDLGLPLPQVLVDLCGAAENNAWRIWFLPLKAATAVGSWMRQRQKMNLTLKWGEAMRCSGCSLLTAESISMGLLTFARKERDGTASSLAAEEDKDMRGLNMQKSRDGWRSPSVQVLTNQWTLKSPGGEVRRSMVNFKNATPVPRIRKT